MPESKEDSSNSDVSEGQVGKYTIAIAAMLSGSEPHRIRRFEEAGLFKPARTEAGQRLYSDSEIELIKEICKLEKEGINLQGVKAILAIRKGERQ
ncbi:MerR family transcriptional regulator [Candidatus Omnitrophota bacterium]